MSKLDTRVSKQKLLTLISVFISIRRVPLTEADIEKNMDEMRLLTEFVAFVMKNK